MDQLPEETITNTVKKVMIEEGFVEVEASGRHVHLNREAIDFLFGKGYQLTKAKELSQPGQFACKERITVAGPKGKLENVAILGPERKDSQVEVSLTDANVLGKQIPVKESGDIDGTPGITLIHNARQLELHKGLIVAKRHIHISPEDAEKLNIDNKEIVQVKLFGKRSLTFDEVVIRIHPNFRTFMHIDFDEANACGFKKGVLGKIIKKTPGAPAENNSQISQRKQSVATKPEPVKEIQINKKIITENDLQQLFLKKVTKVKIPSSSIITPLANDYVRKHKLEIQRYEENKG